MNSEIKADMQSLSMTEDINTSIDRYTKYSTALHYCFCKTPLNDAGSIETVYSGKDKKWGVLVGVLSPCPNCGEHVYSSYIYCPNCGHELESEEGEE